MHIPSCHRSLLDPVITLSMLSYFHCSGESVGVTSHLFLRATGCPAETAPVHLFSYYSQALTCTNINLTTHKALVTSKHLKNDAMQDFHQIVW